MNIEKIYMTWVDNVRDKELSDELKKIENDDKTKTEIFYKNIEFGTAGLRGIIGAGTNRMNIYTVRLATQALSNYLNENYKNPSLVISYDSRKNSKKFSYEASAVLAANNIKVYITEKLQPTPFLSFCVRNLKCSAGIMITASHNTAEYNGYKCYGEDGAQISEDISKKIYDIMCKIDVFKDINICNSKDMFEKNIISFVPKSTYENYLKKVYEQRLQNFPTSNLKVVYTPLNGSGNEFVKKVLSSSGVDICSVKSQEMPDENFSTCPYPNPEIYDAFSEAIKVSEEVDADLILATDPDSDRLGVCIKSNGKYKVLSGNEIAILLFNYIIEQRKKLNSLENNPIVIKTIVSTPMIDEIAKAYDCSVLNVFTGFKNIAAEILKLEKVGEESRYIFGFEESNGYLTGTYVRDKDAVSAALIFCEMASYYKYKNKNVIDVLSELYEQYGYFSEKTLSYHLDGQDGLNKIQKIIDFFINYREKNIMNLEISKIYNYFKGEILNLETNEIVDNALKKSKVLGFDLKDGSKIIVRPSGTEPKVKFYLLVKAESRDDSLVKITKLNEFVDKKIIKII